MQQKRPVPSLKRLSDQTDLLPAVLALDKATLAQQLCKPPNHQHTIRSLETSIREILDLRPVQQGFGKHFDVCNLMPLPLMFHEVVEVLVGNFQKMVSLVRLTRQWKIAQVTQHNYATGYPMPTNCLLEDVKRVFSEDLMWPCIISRNFE